MLTTTRLINLRLKTVNRHLTTSSAKGALRLSHPLKEEELFEDTLVRSIRDEAALRRQRRVEFDVDALAKVAAQSAEARHCTKFVKIAEGSSNRVFLLELDNGTELVAQLPFSFAGPAYLNTASEVATLTFLKNKLKLPVPKVYAWSSRSSPNDVGTEFIISEKVPGVELNTRMSDLRTYSDQLTRDILNIQTRLVETSFSLFGNLYFKEDVDDSLHSHPLYPDGIPDDEVSGNFCIGPSLRRSLWEGERADMKLDRGPWPDVLSYARAMAESEKAWIERYAKPYPPDSQHWRSGDQNDPAAHISAIDRYLKLVPYIIPPAPEASTGCLWHPDMHVSNIFVPQSGDLDIKGLIDWQGASIGPLYQQMRPPDFVDPKLYEALLKEAPAPLSTAAPYNSTAYTALLSCAENTWPDNLAVLRQVLILVCDNWSDLFGYTGIDCPISFTDEERQIHAAQWQERTYAEDLQDKAAAALGVSPDGWVTPEKYDETKRRNKELLYEFLSRAEGEEKKAISRLWPFKDTSA